ncbi:MAG: YfhO family protein, partial [Bacilli bacterium]
MKKNIKNTDNNAIRLLRILREVILIILALAIPLVICLIVFSVNGFYPFDKSGNTILMIDAQSQYISYLRNYREILLSGDSLIYTTSKLFGGDFLSIFSYYLSSPFNLLLVFFPSTEIPAFILYSSIAKICLSSLNMYLLFRFTNKHQADIGQLAFAVSYGLISYSFVYMSNFMWLDGVMILPLVILGLEKAFEKKAYWIYPLALAYALITSWYIGAMICIFVTLFTLTNIFLSKELTKKWYLTLGKFALLSLVGGLIAGAIWVPAFTHFSGTKVTSAFSKLEWFSPAYFFSGLMENSYTTHSLICQNEGYYTMFTSTPALVFFIASFFNSNLKKRERIAYLLLILVYFIGTISTITNDILHFGRAPAWFPGRYTFIIGFLVCFLAEKERSNLVGQKPLGLLFTIIVILGIIFILSEYNSLNGDFTYTYTTSEIIAFAVALFLVTLFYLLPRKLFTAKLPASGAKTISFLTSLAVIVISSYSAFSG